MVYTTKEELLNAKNGGTTLVASKTKTKDAEYQISVPLDACDILDDSVRVNLALIQQSIEDVGKVIGEAMSAELAKVFSKFTE